MHTGEGAEYFEDTPDEEYIEEIVTEEVVEYKKLNEQLDDVIRYLKQQIKEKERIIKAQKKKTAPKKVVTKKVLFLFCYHFLPPIREKKTRLRNFRQKLYMLSFKRGDPPHYFYFQLLLSAKNGPCI